MIPTHVPFDSRSDRQYYFASAIKQMTLTGAEMLRAFELEAKLLSRLLGHPSLPVVIDYNRRPANRPQSSAEDEFE